MPQSNGLGSACVSPFDLGHRFSMLHCRATLSFRLRRCGRIWLWRRRVAAGFCSQADAAQSLHSARAGGRLRRDDKGRFVAERAHSNMRQLNLVCGLAVLFSLTFAVVLSGLAWEPMQVPFLLLAALLAGGALLHRRARQHQHAWERERERRESEGRARDRELAQCLEELEAARLEIESFSHCVARDLRAPLRGIDALAYQLRKDYGELLGEAGRSCVDRIRDGSRQLGGTMDGLLKLSDTNLHAFKRVSVDLSALAREVIAGLEASGARPGLQWLVAEGLRADGDVRQLRLLLHNLLENALKFTGGQAAPRIELGAWPELRNGQKAYFVRDNGAGFDMRRAGKLFRPFERLHAQDEFPGHGVGLAVVQRIVRRHRGQLWAEGAPGKGAMIYFTLG